MTLAQDTSHPPAEKPMPRNIRRSAFVLDAHDPQLATRAFNSHADAIFLNLIKPGNPHWPSQLTSTLPSAIEAAAAAGAEIFIIVESSHLEAQLNVAIYSGLTGIVLQSIEGAQTLERASNHLTKIEHERGIVIGSLEIQVWVDNAVGVGECLSIARQSQRFGGFIIDDETLCRALGMQTQPTLSFDPLEYIKSELITVATSVGAQAMGMSYPLGLTRENSSPETVKQCIKRARDTGFKGALCAHENWISHCNVGFQPSPEEVDYYRRVIEVFAEGIRRGMASVPLEGKMIDVPVDLRAKLYVQWAQRAHQRDEEKIQASNKKRPLTA